MLTKILPLLFVALLSGCVSVISSRSDEDAWKEYFSEWNEQVAASRTIASAASIISQKPSIKILRQILQSLPLRDYLISCESGGCYESKLVIAFDEAFRRVKEQGINIETADYMAEQKTFLSKHSFENMSALVDAFHRRMLSGIELRASHRAKDFESGCASADDDSAKPIQLDRFGEFVVGMTYLPRAHYQCLSQQWGQELQELLDETCQRLGVVIKTAEARAWIVEKQISPIYRKTLGDLLLKKHTDEQVLWNREWSVTATQINWKRPLEVVVASETPALRKKFHYLNVESLLTEHHSSLK